MRWICSLLIAGLLATATSATAQTFRPAFLILEQERVLAESLAGRDVLAQEDAERTELIAEGRALDQELEAEEQQLTDLRPRTDPASFQALADAFDAKVVRIRAEQEEKASALSQAAEQRRRDFFSQVAPILQQILTETGAGAVVEQRAVLMSNQNLNITDRVITRLDDVYKKNNLDNPDATSSGN